MAGDDYHSVQNFSSWQLGRVGWTQQTTKMVASGPKVPVEIDAAVKPI